MDCSEARLDTIEAQRSKGLSHDPESVPEFLTNFRLSELYNLYGEYVSMNPEIFSGMRAGNRSLLEEMKSYETPMECLKSNGGGDSILHLAAASGHLELVKNIVTQCPCLLLEPNSNYQIPLHVAARAGHSAVVKALIESITYFTATQPGGDRETLNLYVLKDINGDTPLHAALKYIHEKTELLMYHDRIGNKQFLSHLITHWRHSKCYSFCDASSRLMETAACLVKAYQRASFLENKDGISPLYLAVETGNVSLVNAMLNCPGNNVLGKASNLASQLEGRKSIIHAALKAKNLDVLDVILNEDSCLIKERDEEGRTCLSVGASVGFYEGICKLLDQSPKSVYECNEDGSFPTHMAAEKGHQKIIKEILKRCPDSKELINKQGQNILHIAAKNGKTRYVLSDVKHLVGHQDVDGNTPLHLATINWHPRSVHSLASTKTEIMNIQNKEGLRPLDIAEINLRSEYVLRERLTLMVLLCAYAPRGVGWLPTSGMTLRSKSEHIDAKRYKDHINGLLLMATLVATVTFAAGFTLPGGFNTLGMAILANDPGFFLFVIQDTLAMQSSVVAIVALIWAQLGDPAIVRKAFHLALPSLFIALVAMSWAFYFAMQATTKQNVSLTNAITIMNMVFYLLMIALLAPYVIPQVPGIPFLRTLTRVYLSLLLLFVKEDEDEKYYTSHMRGGWRSL